LTASPNEPFLHDIPIRFLVDLPLEKSAASRSLLLRYFNKRGGRLFSCPRDYLRLPVKCLEGSEILLNRFFIATRISNDCTRGDTIMAYLEPIEALLEGIVTEALTYEQDAKVALSLIFSIFDALQLPTKATKYAAVCNDADIWQDIKTTTRDRLFQKKNMQSCFPTFLNLAFYSPVIRKHYGEIEELSRAESGEGVGPNTCASLSLALLSAFGESVHHHDIVVASRKREAYQALSVMLNNCTSRVFLEEAVPPYVNQHVVSYFVVTLDYILDSLRKDQYSLPDGLDILHAKLKSVVARKIDIKCDPQFFSIVERYLGLFEEQILNTLTAFSAMRISKEDLQRLDRSTRILQTLNKVATSWGLEVSADQFFHCL
jgi:hypothetical protein